MTNQEYADAIRMIVRHENELTNHRLGWMATMNSRLFAALGLAWGDEG
jgi:hypothetical protein